MFTINPSGVPVGAAGAVLSIMDGDGTAGTTGVGDGILRTTAGAGAVHSSAMQVGAMLMAAGVILIGVVLVLTAGVMALIISTVTHIVDGIIAVTTIELLIQIAAELAITIQVEQQIQDHRIPEHQDHPILQIIQDVHLMPIMLAPAVPIAVMV